MGGEKEGEKEKVEEKEEEGSRKKGGGRGRRGGEDGQLLKLALKFHLKRRFKLGSQHADVLYLTLNGNLVRDTSTIL